MKSMTGFGRAEVTTGTLRLGVEVSSVNRKQCDIVINLPREWNTLEIEARKLVAGVVSRGRIHVQVHVEHTTGSSTQLQVDESLAAQYVEALRSIANRMSLPLEIQPGDLLRAPGIFSTGEAKTTTDEIWPDMKQAIEQALVAFGQSREREGAHLKQDLLARLEVVRQVAESIAKETPEVARMHRENLMKRLEDAGLPLPMDDERLLKEIALFADKCDISEEATRLQGHLDEFHRLIGSNEPQGRAMDFLTQELNRELNTMGSKGNSTGIAHLVVTGKTEVERIREQVQNVE